MAEMNKGALLKSLTGELCKTFIAFDVENRAQFVYQAAADAQHGGICLVTEYIYSTPTSTTIVGTKEAETTWNSVWDADFTI